MCSYETVTVHCDGSCKLEGNKECDGFACPTGQCLRTSVTYLYCDSGEAGGYYDPGANSGGGGPGGNGSTNSGAPTGNSALEPFTYFPNDFDNPVFDDPNYINALKSQYFWEDLDYGSQLWAIENPVSYNQMIQYLIQNNWSNSAQLTINQLIELCRANNSTFSINNSITAQNSISFNNVTEFQTFLNNFNDGLANQIDLIDVNSDTKVAKFKFTVNFFTDFNVEIQQKINPWSLENISSSISGNTFSLSYSQMTPANGGDITTNGNIKTIKFSGDLNINVFIEGIGTLHTYHITFIVNVNSVTGQPISGQIIGLP
jgi:hypothetical protein